MWSGKRGGHTGDPAGLEVVHSYSEQKAGDISHLSSDPGLRGSRALLPEAARCPHLPASARATSVQGPFLGPEPGDDDADVQG